MGKIMTVLHGVEVEDVFEYSVNSKWAIRGQPQHGARIYGRVHRIGEHHSIYLDNESC